MAGKKNQGGSGDDLFGEFEDSFFKSGEDDSFWDDDTVVAYEESMAVPKAELANLRKKLDEEDEEEAEAPPAPEAGPTDVTVFDENPADPNSAPADLEAASAQTLPEPSEVAEEGGGDAAEEFFRMAPPPTRPAPETPASAPARPPDTALFSAPTLILSPGEGEAALDEDEDAAPDSAAADPSAGAAAGDGDEDAGAAVPDRPATEEEPIAMGDAPPPDDAADDADSRMLSEVVRRADDEDSAVAVHHEPAPLDAGVMDVAEDSAADDGDPAETGAAAIRLPRAAREPGGASDGAPGMAPFLEGSLGETDLPTELAPPSEGSSTEAEASDPELGEDAPPAPDPEPSSDVESASDPESASDLASASEATPEPAEVSAPVVPAPPALPPRVPVASEDAPPADAGAPLRYTAATGDAGRWEEAALSLEREAEAVSGVERGALLAAAGSIRFRMLGDWEAAEGRFEEAVGLGVEDERLYRAYADIVAGRGAFDEMRSLLEKRAAVGAGAVASESIHDIALVERNSLRRPEEAADVLQRALSLDGEDWFALRLLRELQHRAGDWAGLADTLGRMAALVQAGESARLLVERGRVLSEELHDTTAALESWKDALEADPSFSPAFLARERGLASLGSVAELVDLYAAEAERLEGADRGFYLARAARLGAASGLDADRVAALYSGAIEAGASPSVRQAHQGWLTREGRHEALAASLEAEAAASTGTAAAWPLYRLAQVRELHLGDAEGALAALQQAVKADPAASPAVESISRILEGQGRHQDLLAALESRLEGLTDPNLLVSNLYRMGELAEGPLDDAAGARVWFERILDTAPAYLPAIESLERVYQRLEAWSDLCEILARRAELTDAPSDAALALHQAGSAAEFRLGDADRASGFYERSLAAMPNFGPALDARVRLLTAGADWQTLATTLAAAADASGEDPAAVSLRYRTARVAAERLGDPEQAILQLRMGLELSPGFLPAIELLRSLATSSGDWAAVSQLHLQEASSTEDTARRHWRMLAAADAAGSVEGLDAMEIVASILEDDPTHPGARALRADHIRTTGDTQSLLAMEQRAAEAAPDGETRARLSIGVADLAASAGDAALAMQAVGQVLSAPDDRPLVALARVAESFGNWEEAARALEAADAPDAVAVARLREAWDTDGAVVLAAWQAAMEAEPERLEAAAGVERALSRLGQREGLAAAHEALATQAGSVSVQRVHAVLAAHLHAGAEDAEAAARCYRLAFDGRPERGRAFEALLLAAIEAKDTESIQGLFASISESGTLAEAEALGLAGLAADAVEVLGAVLPGEGKETAADLPALVQLENNLASMEDWKAVFSVLARRRQISGSAEERAAIDGKRRWVLAEKLAETEEAWEFYRQLHEEDPADTAVLESLARIAGVRGETALAIQYLEGLAANAPDGATAARYRRRVAEAHLAGDASDAAREAAQGAYLAALDHNPEDMDSLAGLRVLAEQAEDWRALVGVLAREATVLKGEDQVDRYRAIASTWEDRIGDQGVAIDAWRKVLTVAPGDAVGLERLVELTRAREDWSGFAEFAQERLAHLEGTERSSLQSELGRVYFKRLYREDEAVRFLDAAISSDHPDAEAAELLERIYAARGQWDLVVEANLSRAQASEGEERVALLLRAAQTRAETLHDRDGAAAIYAKVLDEEPDNAEALRFRGDWLYNSKEFDAAAEVFGRMEAAEAERDLDDFDVRIEVALYYFRFAEAHRKMDRIEEALTRFEQGLALNPSHLPSLEAVGPLYMTQERWADAGKVYRQILQLTGGQGDPTRLARTYVNLGRVELQQGNLDKAKKRFNKALDLRANDIKALQGIASVLFARKDWNNLLNVYNNIIYHAQEPAEVVDAYLTKGYVLDARLDLPDKAQQHYEKSLAFDPSQPKALLRLAELALRKQDWPEATNLADRGLTLEVEDAAVLGGLHLVRVVAFGASNDEPAVEEAFAAAVKADATLADRLGDSAPAWADTHEVLRERLRARL